MLESFLDLDALRQVKGGTESLAGDLEEVSGLIFWALLRLREEAVHKVDES